MSERPQRLGAREAIALVAVPGSFTELPPPPERAQAPDGPLGWPGYDEVRQDAARRTTVRESVLCGTATIGSTPVVVISSEFGYLGGSLGERTGDLIEAAHDLARRRRLPVVTLLATGGSRMQEGMRALVQLQRVARQTALTRAAGLPQVAVVQDPATGGGWVTLGAAADVTLAVTGAQVGFAGSRVRPPEASPRAYLAEAQWENGAVDTVVPVAELRRTLGLWLRMLSAPSTTPAQPPAALGRRDLPATGWDAVRHTRSPERPRADAYLDAYFSCRVLLSGDRAGGRDDGVVCGIGEHDSMPVAFVAQGGTSTRPAGYRTATRLIRLADRLRLPVLTLVDTPGAANDPEAERDGVGAAIAELFEVVATAATPVTTLVIGEGGSGGALALSAPGNTWITPDGYFSVIAPESAAAILKRPPEDVPRVADTIQLRPQDLVRLGVVRGIRQHHPPAGERPSHSAPGEVRT